MFSFEIIATIVNAAGVWLMARRTAWCWPVNLIGVVMYVWIFLVSKLYSDMLLQGFFAASCVYGWFQWKKNESAETETISVAIPSLREVGVGVAAAIAFALALGFTMVTFTDAASPWLDSTLTSFSLLATLGSSRRFIESWWLWISLDVIYICLYVYKHLYPTAILYAVYIAICFYGVAEWRRASRSRSGEPAPPMSKTKVIDPESG